MLCPFHRMLHKLRNEGVWHALIYVFVPIFLLQNNTSWKPDTCQDCTCYSDIVICRPTRCRNPQCDFQRVRLKSLLTPRPLQQGYNSVWMNEWIYSLEEWMDGWVGEQAWWMSKGWRSFSCIISTQFQDAVTWDRKVHVTHGSLMLLTLGTGNGFMCCRGIKLHCRYIWSI